MCRRTVVPGSPPKPLLRRGVVQGLGNRRSLPYRRNVMLPGPITPRNLRKGAPALAVLHLAESFSEASRGNPERTCRFGPQREGAGGQDKRGIIVAREIGQSGSFASAADAVRMTERTNSQESKPDIDSCTRRLICPAEPGLNRPSSLAIPCPPRGLSPPGDTRFPTFHRPLLGTTKREAGCNLETRASYK